MSRTYQNAATTESEIIDRRQQKELADYLVSNGQMLIPMVELIEQSRISIDRFIDLFSKAAIEAVLQLSADKISGPRHQGRATGDVVRYGYQQGSVPLSDRRLKVVKPRLRRGRSKAMQEILIPAYETLNSAPGMGEKVSELMMRGISTRKYKQVIREMVETVGVSKSSVSRSFVEQTSRMLEQLAGRRFDDLDLLIIYLDGLVFGEHHIIGAIGVDCSGEKHVLGLQQGASENAAAVTCLLERLVELGVDSQKAYLFVIDGSKALRSAINRVFGSHNPVQRCRSHKIRNVCDNLPDHLKDQYKAIMRAAYKLPHKEGIARLTKHAAWLDQECPTAAASLREGLEETFTINRLELPVLLCRCLATTNIIESPNSDVRLNTRRVCRWRDGKMVLRWATAAFLTTEHNFRRIMGYKFLWILKARLNEIARLKSELDQQMNIA